MTSSRRITLVASALLATACASTERDADRPPAERTRAGVAESLALATSPDTVYRRRLADLVRRAGLVSMDSTARLFAAIARTPDSSLHVIRQALGCETMVGIRRYGPAAWQRAYRRTIDSLVSTGFRYPADVERMEAAPGPPLEFRGPNSCGEERYPGVADSLAREPRPSP